MNDDTCNRDLYSGMIRLHILHHAENEFNSSPCGETLLIS